MDALAFLDHANQLKPRPVYILHGDEDFLKRKVVAALRFLVLEAEENAFGTSAHEGDKATFAEVRDELDTIPFLSPRRLVVVENADPFVTRFRPLLEKYVAEPSANGVLVLDVKSWPTTTKLSKLVDADSTIICKAPAVYKFPEWCSLWAATHYAKELPSAAARLLVDLVGPEMGQLDQELLKLSIYVGTAKRIDTADVDKLVGWSRAENMWRIFDAIGAGQTGEALAIVERLFDHGDEPLRILGAFSMQLRRLALAARLNQRGQPLGAALHQAGVPPFAQKGCEQQLRHLGRRRTDRLYDWLLEADLGLKGSSQLTPRTLLEMLVVRLARKA